MKTTFTQIFNKLVSIETKSVNIKSSIKTKLLSKEEKEFVTNNLDKFVKALEKREQKINEEILFNKDKIIADLYKISVKKYRELKQKANEICKLFDAGYSMGGTIILYCTKGLLRNKFGSYSNCQEYAKTSRYKATHGYNEIYLTIKELDQIEIIGGVPTIKLSKDKISECLNLVSKGKNKHYQIYFEKGFITKTFHGVTYQECKNWREKEYLQQLKQRNPILATKEIERRKQDALNKFVGFNHSIRVGNCVQGTKAFVQRHKLDANFGYKLDYLIGLEPNSIFVQKLFNNFV